MVSAEERSVKEDNDPSQNQQDRLRLLPDEIKRYLCIFLDGKSISDLKRTSKNWASIISDDNTPVENGKTLKKIYTEKLSNNSFWKLDPFRNLLSHAALGELEAAEMIWKSNSELLNRRGIIYHPKRIYDEGKIPVDIPFDQSPGRYKYNHTIYQIYLMNSEFEEAEKVGELMPLKEKQKQFHECFPHGEIKKYNFNLEEAKKLLQVLFNSVAQDKCIKIEYDENNDIKEIIMSDQTRKALNKLYVYAKPKSEHEIGLVFDPRFYDEARKLYDNNQFSWSLDQDAIWNICVEEWLAGCLGTGYLGPHSQGFANPMTRRGCVLADGSSYFSFRRPSIPGHHFFVGNNGSPARIRIVDPNFPLLAFSMLMSSKDESKDRLYATIFPQQNNVMSNSDGFVKKP